jgi:hypothetical protein
VDEAQTIILAAWKLQAIIANRKGVRVSVRKAETDANTSLEVKEGLVKDLLKIVVEVNEDTSVLRSVLRPRLSQCHQRLILSLLPERALMLN